LAKYEHSGFGHLAERATAADFVRSFAKWRDTAQSHPVEIASHGRVTHVLLSAQEYERLAGSAPVQPDNAGTALFGLGEWMKDAIIATDGDGMVVYSNHVARAMTGVNFSNDGSIHLIDAVPALRGTLMEMNLGRTLASHEPTYADVPSPFRKDGWLLCRTIPLKNRFVIILSDITEDVQRDRMVDTKAALVKALTDHGSVGFMRVSTRGVIKRIEDPFCEWLNLPGERIRGRRLLDFVPREDRAAFRETLESVLDGEDFAPFNLALTPNGPGVLRMKCAMSHLRGHFGIEGAVLICTREHDSLGK